MALSTNTFTNPIVDPFAPAGTFSSSRALMFREVLPVRPVFQSGQLWPRDKNASITPAVTPAMSDVLAVRPLIMTGQLWPRGSKTASS